MGHGKWSAIAASVWLSGIALVCEAETQSSVINISRAANGEWRLEARQASLPKLLDEIASRTASKVHYSVLPDGPVDATCVGASLAPLLQCLLGDGINMAFRQGDQGYMDKAGGGKTEEVWIMGSSLVQGRQTVSGQCAEKLQPASMSENGRADKTEQWLKQVKSKDPAQRAQAVAELVAADPAYDGKVKTALYKALSDKDARVRGQAIGALVGREGETAAGEQLRQALNDANAEVRLMALDNIEQDESLLRLAAQDDDEVVRQMAEMKLEQLVRQ